MTFDLSPKGLVIGGDSNVVTFNHTEILQISEQEITSRELITTSPYKGLKPFESRDKDLFFGRDNFIKTLVDQLESTNLIVLLGASGSGKSSVVKAGLIPWLERKYGTGFTNLTFTPDVDPFESFYASLRSQYSQAEAKIARQIEAETLIRVVDNLKQPNEFWFIFIDQFEELFTTSNEHKCQEFINGLMRLSQAKLSNLRIMATMRADFLERLSDYPQLVEATQKHRPMIVEMQPNELRVAIEQPAAHHGIVFEAELVAKIIAELQGQAGCLPLLQYTLNLLWEDEVKTNSINDRTLNISTYQKLGGVRGALQQHVNYIYQKLSPTEQQATQRIFLKLVGIGENAETGIEWKPVRRRAQLSEFGDDERDVLLKLVNESLLVSDAELSPTVAKKGFFASTLSRKIEQTNATIEITHEILLTSWDRLNRWIKENRQGIALRNRLYEDVKRWQTNKPEDELWTGSKLEQVLELKKDDNFERVLGGFNDVAERFIDASVGVRDRQIQEKLVAAQKLAEADRKARKEAEKRVTAQKKANQKLRIWSLIAVTFGLAASVLGITSFYRSQEARLKEQAANLKVQLQLSNDIENLLESIQLVGDNQNLNQGWLKPQTKLMPEVQSVLYQAVDNTKEKYRFNTRQDGLTVAMSGNGRYLVSGSWNGKIELWNMKQKTKVDNLYTYQNVTSVAISDDGHYIVSGSSAGIVKLWDVKQEKEINIFNHHKSGVGSVAISGDSRYIVRAGDDGIVKLWDVKQEKEIDIFNNRKSEVYSVAISDDGRYIVRGSQHGTVKLWDVKQKQELEVFNDPKKGVHSVAISDDGRYVVSGIRDGTFRLWDVQQEKEIHSFDAHQDGWISVAISGDGRYIVSTDWQGIIQLWDVKEKQELVTFKNRQGRVFSVAISDDGSHLVNSTENGAIKLWDVKKQQGIDIFDKFQNVDSVAISGNGRYVVAGSRIGEIVKLWDRKKKQKIKIFDQSQSEVYYAVISGDSSHIVGANIHGKIVLWDVKKQQEIEFFDKSQNHVYSIAISRDGRYVVAGSLDGIAELWDRKEQRKIKIFDEEFQNEVTSVAISGDGRYVAIVTNDNTSGSIRGKVKLWDREKEHDLTNIFQLQSGVSSVAISDDGHYIVSADINGKISLWDVEKSKQIYDFNTHQNGVNSVAISKDGRYIVTGGSDKTVKLWDIEEKKELYTFNTHQNRVNSVAISGDGHYIVSDGSDKTVKLWRGTNWQEWLAVGCDSIRLHPDLVWSNNEFALKVANTCMKFGNWDNSEKVEFLEHQGLALAKEKADLKSAKTKFKQAHQLDPTRVNLAELEAQAQQLALIEEGKNLARNGDLEQAKTKFKQAHQLNSARVNLAELEAQAQQLAASNSHFEEELTYICL